MENEYEVMHGVCEFQSVGIVINGNYIPTYATIEQPLLIDRWLDEHKVHNQYNSSTKLCLINALSPTKHGRVDSYETTKEIWDALTIAHEGTSNVKQNKINMLVTQYKMFKMREDESISDMFARFQGITNKMRQLGRTYDNADQVNKILRSLSKKWRPNVTAIQEVKDLNTLKLNDLLGSPMVHELELNQDDEIRKSKSIAFKSLVE